MTTPLQSLADHGQSPWIDYISRPFVRDGDMAALVRDGIVGVTSNPTIFQAAIADGTSYDEQLREVLREQTDPKEVFLALARDDIREACDLLRDVFERGESTRDGWVSLEVDPNLASDAAGTATEAQRLHRMIDRPNLFVKIPGTEPGLQAIEDTIAAGIPVNVTLLFSLERHRAAAEAYLRGLGGSATRRRSAIGRLSRVVLRLTGRHRGRSPARRAGRTVRSEGNARDRQREAGLPDLQGALQRRRLGGARGRGASPQRCLWASTSTKNPEYRDVLYVEELIGPQTVNTMPRETIEAIQDHGRVESTLERDVDQARRTFERFAEAGIDYDDVVAVLEREGVEKFADSFKKLLEGVARKRDQLVAA